MRAIASKLRSYRPALIADGVGARLAGDAVCLTDRYRRQSSVDQPLLQRLGQATPVQKNRVTLILALRPRLEAFSPLRGGR